MEEMRRMFEEHSCRKFDTKTIKCLVEENETREKEASIEDTVRSAELLGKLKMALSIQNGLVPVKLIN